MEFDKRVVVHVPHIADGEIQRSGRTVNMVKVDKWALKHYGTNVAVREGAYMVSLSKSLGQINKSTRHERERGTVICNRFE
jgi:hypothetical protein